VGGIHAHQRRGQAGSWNGTFGAEVHDIVGNDDHAVGIYNLSADRDGQHGEWHWVNVYHVRDGRIVEYWAHVVDQYSFDEFWSGAGCLVASRPR
jgi:ketosteroid isomerase-like protein